MAQLIKTYLISNSFFSAITAAMSYNKLQRIGQSIANSNVTSLKFLHSASRQLQQQQLRQVQRCYSQFSLNHPSILPFHTSTLPNNKRLCVVLLPISGVSCAAASQLAKTENTPLSSSGGHRPEVDDVSNRSKTQTKCTVII